MKLISLQALYKFGGIYLDLDTICVKPFTELLTHHFVMGQELNLPYVAENKRHNFN